MLGDKYRNILQKYGLRGVVYGDAYSKGATNYVSFNGRSDLKSRDAFTYGDDGKYIPLDKRGDINNPDIRYSIKEDDAQRFRNELQDYIDGKLDNRHVFRLGTTPEAMKLVGADDLPIELSAVRLSKKEVKHDLNIADLKDLPVELADPVAIFQSEMIPNGLIVLTELPSSQVGKQNRFVVPVLKINVSRKNINSTVEAINVLGFDETEVFERFNESSPYWNTRRGQSFTQSIQSRLSDNEMSEIDLNLDLVSKYQRESQDENLEKVLAQIDIDLLNSKLSKGLLFKEKNNKSIRLFRNRIYCPK